MRPNDIATTNGANHANSRQEPASQIRVTRVNSLFQNPLVAARGRAGAGGPRGSPQRHRVHREETLLRPLQRLTLGPVSASFLSPLFGSFGYPGLSTTAGPTQVVDNQGFMSRAKTPRAQRFKGFRSSVLCLASWASLGDLCVFAREPVLVAAEGRAAWFASFAVGRGRLPRFAPKKIGWGGDGRNGPNCWIYQDLWKNPRDSSFSSIHPPRSGFAPRKDIVVRGRTTYEEQIAALGLART